MTVVVKEKLDDLVGALGIRDAVETLIFALPYIIERQNALAQFLRVGDWESARHIAHKALSSVRLYASSQLETLLQQVRQQEIAVISTAEFQATLDGEFSTVIHTLEDWLSEHPLWTQ